MQDSRHHSSWASTGSWSPQSPALPDRPPRRTPAPSDGAAGSVPRPAPPAGRSSAGGRAWRPARSCAAPARRPVRRSRSSSSISSPPSCCKRQASASRLRRARGRNSWGTFSRSRSERTNFCTSSPRLAGSSPSPPPAVSLNMKRKRGSLASECSRSSACRRS